MLKRLATIGDTSRSRPLLQVLLKLLCLCAKVKRNVEVLIRPELATVSSLLSILQLCLTDPSQNTVTQQILDVSTSSRLMYITADHGYNNLNLAVAPPSCGVALSELQCPDQPVLVVVIDLWMSSLIDDQ